MKKSILILLLTCLTNALFGQGVNVFQRDTAISKYHYFILNETRSDQKILINEVDAASINDLGCDKKIYTAQLYNVFLSPQKLVLFTVLPAINNGAPKWQKIDINSIKSNLLSTAQLDSMHGSNIKKFQQTGFHNTALVKMGNFKVILKKADGYYVNETDCLTEFFIIIKYNYNSSFLNNTPTAVIDTTSPPLSVAEFEMPYFRRLGKYSYNHSDYLSISQFGVKTQVNYLSNKLIVNNLECYFYWELYSWGVDRMNISRGIDRFIYSPKIGIIAGDYTFYFRRNALTPKCEKLDFYQYLGNEVKLNPVKIIKDFK
jgi:hypothetical protein